MGLYNFCATVRKRSCFSVESQSVSRHPAVTVDRHRVVVVVCVPDQTTKLDRLFGNRIVRVVRVSVGQISIKS